MARALTSGSRNVGQHKIIEVFRCEADFEFYCIPLWHALYTVWAELDTLVSYLTFLIGHL
jgi:hypothetical protein